MHCLRDRDTTCDDQGLGIDGCQSSGLNLFDVRTGLRLHHQQVPDVSIEEDNIADDGSEVGQDRRFQTRYPPAGLS